MTAAVTATGTRAARLAARRQRNPATRAGRYLATVALIGTATIVVVIGAGLVLGRWRVDPVRTGSMTPTLPVGSAVIVTPEPFSALRPGQIIIFHAPDDNRLLVHRVIEVSGPATAPRIRTKGDHDLKPDPWHATLTSQPVWRVRHVIPVAGYAIQWGRAWIVKAFMLALAAIGLFLAAAPSFVLKHQNQPADIL